MTNINKEKIIKLLRSRDGYIMDIQRTYGCYSTKANEKRMIESLIEFGIDKGSAIDIVKNWAE